MRAFVFALLATLRLTSADPTPDDNEECSEWAKSGECVNNPGFMLVGLVWGTTVVCNFDQPPHAFTAGVLRHVMR